MKRGIYMPEGNNPTPEEIQDMVFLCRLLYGDLPQSIFFPILSDEEIEALLKLEKWNIQRAARRAALAAAFYMTTTPTRERSGDIESWSAAATEYRRVLDAFLDESNASNLPYDLIPYAAGISIADVCASNNDLDKNRSPLARITPCLAWWTRVKHYERCCSKDILDLLKLK